MAIRLLVMDVLPYLIMWRSIIGYEGWYEVSDVGDVRRIRRGRATHPGLVLKKYLKRKYLSVVLYRDGKPSGKRVAGLVCESFHGPRPKNHQVNHINSDKHDNSASNLEWVTPQQNILHSVAAGHHGSHIGTSKLVEAQVAEIRLCLAMGHTHKEIAEIYGVSRSAITLINSGKNWKHS